MKYDQETKEFAVELYKTGLSHSEVAKQVGTVKSTVGRWVREAGIKAHKDYSGNEPLQSRMASHSVTDDIDDCWDWTSNRDTSGYPMITINGVSGVMAHRVNYELHVGSIPDEFTIDHLCANKGCVNPQHLEPVTGEENIKRGGEPHFEIRGRTSG